MCLLLDLQVHKIISNISKLEVSIHTYKEQQNWTHVTEKVYKSIDQMFDEEFQYFNREGRGWTRFSERSACTLNNYILFLYIMVEHFMSLY